MTSQIYISLPVTDLEKSANFYSGMGFTVNPQLSSDTNKCMVWNDSIFVMIMTHDRFKDFTSKPIMDPKVMSAAGYSLSANSLDEVNKIVEGGLAAGGTEPNAMVDHGYMQERSIDDPDGYNWGIFYMDMTKFPGNQN